MNDAALTLAPDYSGQSTDTALVRSGEREVERQRRAAFLKQSALYLGLIVSANQLRALAVLADG